VTLRENPPFFFEKPDLEPGGHIAEQFLEDLVSLAVQLPPRDQDVDEVIIAAAHYLRSDTKQFMKSLEKAYVERVAALLPDDTPIQRVPANVARAILDLTQLGEDLTFVYNGVAFLDSDCQQLDAERTWLVGVGDRLICFAMDDAPILVWQGDAQVEVNRVKRYVNDGCQITGGQLLPEPTSAVPRLIVTGPIVGRYGRYFAPLVKFCSNH